MENSAQPTRFQRFTEKSVYYLIGLYAAYFVVLAVESLLFLFSSASQPGTVLYYVVGVFSLLFAALALLVPAFSIFYIILCLWKEQGWKKKLLKIAVVPACIIVMGLLGMGVNAITEPQYNKLNSVETIGSISYSIPGNWKSDDDEMTHRHFNSRTGAVIFVSIEEGQSLESACQAEKSHLSQEGAKVFTEVDDIGLDAPYSCYTYTNEDPDWGRENAFLMLQHSGKLYLFDMQADEKSDLELFHKICESIKLQ